LLDIPRIPVSGSQDKHGDNTRIYTISSPIFGFAVPYKQQIVVFPSSESNDGSQCSDIYLCVCVRALILCEWNWNSVTLVLLVIWQFGGNIWHLWMGKYVSEGSKLPYVKNKSRFFNTHHSFLISLILYMPTLLFNILWEGEILTRKYKGNVRIRTPAKATVAHGFTQR